MELLNPLMSIEDAQGQYASIEEAFDGIDQASTDLGEAVVHQEDKEAVAAIQVIVDEFRRGDDEFIERSRNLDRLGIRNPTQLAYEVANMQDHHREWVFYLGETVDEGFEFEQELNYMLNSLPGYVLKLHGNDYVVYVLGKRFGLIGQVIKL